MALSIPDYPDPDDVPGTTIPAAYAWIPELTISYAYGRASFTLWIHQSAAAAGSWPDGTRIPAVAAVRVAAGDPVPGHPDATFPELDAVMARAAGVASSWFAAATTPEGQSAVLATVATGGAIRAALYALLRELVFPGAVEVE